MKKILSTILGSDILFKLSRRYYYGLFFPYVQVVTYHDTPKSSIDKLRSHFEWYRENYSNCNLDDLRGLLEHGLWGHDKPGLIVSFDDGLRSNYDVMVELLDEFGFTGWFMVPAGFIDLDSEQQIEFVRSNLIEYDDSFRGDRISMSWDELKMLKNNSHVIVNHSMNHKRLSKELSDDDLEIEISESRKVIESKLECRVDMFAWVGGEEWSYSRKAYNKMIDENYNMIFCTNCFPINSKQSSHFLQRYHVDANYDLTEIRFALGGAYDVFYALKRMRINKLLSG